MANDLMPKDKKVKFSVALRTDAYKNLINETLGNQKVAQKFIAEISTVVAQNNQLQECDAKTILSAGLLAQTLNLPLAPALGFAYIIPYNTKDGGKVAQFQVSWKGLIQLAIRTGQYKSIGVRPVHDGEYKGQDEFGEDTFKFDHKFDEKKTVGYYAYFILVNGFKKSIYWTKEQCESHAKRYSAEYRSKGTGKWKEMFDEMAMKTVLKQLISKWGIMSVDMQTVVQADQSVINDDGTYDYVDNEPADEEPKKKTTVSNSIIPED